MGHFFEIVLFFANIDVFAASSVIDLLVTHLRFVNLKSHAVLGCEGYLGEEV